MITVSNPEDTRILYITARHPDSQTAADIANAYATAAKRFIVQTMKTDEPSTFSIALVPGVASGGGITGYVIRGVFCWARCWRAVCWCWYFCWIIAPNRRRT